MITGFSHVTVSATDIERSTAFYEQLGLEVVRRIGELDSEGVARAFHLTRGHLTVVHLAPPGTHGMTIDLVQWLDPPPVGVAYPTLNNLGLTRLAFRVDDIETTVAELKAKGVTFLTEDIQSFGQGVRSIVLHDPDGAIVQLISGLN